ncbi:hypothetical protein Ddye_026197 [Dipteronia dyeriana]|uniref:GDSL esterase/lipase n=1 Tax=Dipteronia dyeriana TaxID=168575 RepID=A0AAD9WQ68_9ROSI|nr:hypothetical protein Ddye_026197 [Dipteronia dyeriana]
MIFGFALAILTVAPLVEARAFFVIGDSLVDSGNNNYLATTTRADAPPYGIDYPTRQPTRRFSNGLNIPDIIRHKLLNGANFASAGIGILNDTGIQFLNIIRMFRQLDYFEEYQCRVSGLIGAQKTGELVNKARVLITVGGNDFVNNNYMVPFSVLVTEIGPLGCVPAELAMRSTNGGCSVELQRAATLYNPQLVEMIKRTEQ